MRGFTHELPATRQAAAAAGLLHYAVAPPPDPLPRGERGPEGELLGLLVASISIDSQFGDLRLDDDVRKVALVCPLDTPRAGQRTHVLLRHPLYDEQSEAHEIDNDRLIAFATVDGSPATDAHYHDPLYKDRFLASFARVPGTHLVVVVQQRYADAVRSGIEPAQRIVLWGGAALAVAALVIAVVALQLAQRRATR